ncbi:hypothetical protein HDV02_004387 [Globomyces sp. JEL0801]|nr:hypothetical protein HDV02_004387 [Globomyces sp. JEL0801]
MSRITLTTVMTGPIAGLKTVIKDFLAAHDVGCILQTTMVEVGNTTSRLTLLMMEGETETLFQTRDLLVLKLDAQFPGIKYDTWDQGESEQPWPTELIKPTFGYLKRNSSGFVDEETVETFSTDGTFLNERIVKAAKNLNGLIIKAVKQASPLVRHAAQTAGEIKQVYSRASSLTDGLVKNARFSYQNRTVLLNTQPFLDWTLLLQEVKKVFQIAENSVVNIYEKLDDGTQCQIIDISGIEEKGRYYLQTDSVKKISTMEEFFEKLKTERKRPKSDIIKVREFFTEQGILFEELMVSGELALTDEKLEKIGISQLGLRTTILAIIKSNQC